MWLEETRLRDLLVNPAYACFLDNGKIVDKSCPVVYDRPSTVVVNTKVGTLYGKL